MLDTQQFTNIEIYTTSSVMNSEGQVTTIADFTQWDSDASFYEYGHDEFYAHTPCGFSSFHNFEEWAEYYRESVVFHLKNTRLKQAKTQKCLSERSICYVVAMKKTTQ